MNSKENEKTKKIKAKNLVYIGVMILFFILVGIIFFYSVKFVIKNINKVFTVKSEKTIHALDIPRYTLVEKKLNLPINTPKKDNITPSLENEPEIVSTSIEEEPLKIEEVTLPVISQENISINILNGARKAGVAGSMSKKIEGLGFNNITIGDSKTIYPITTIFTKNTASDFMTAIVETVKSLYPKTIIKTSTAESKYDLIIVVGKE